MKASSHRAGQAGDGGRHWYHITGLPGWKRARLGLPAFGDEDCHAEARPDPGHDHRERADRSLRHSAILSGGNKHDALAAGGLEARPGKERRTHTIVRELRRHSPFTALGTLTGALVLGGLLLIHAPRSLSTTLFWTLHPLHVLLSALVTTAMFRLHGGKGLGSILGVGYFGSIGIATLSDCLLPYVGEWMLDLPHRGLHLGFIEKWWLVNPIAIGGIVAGWVWPQTKISHAGHVLLSTWASLFHITMALGTSLSIAQGSLILVFLFLSVWLPCCTSDIVFPLLFTPGGKAVTPLAPGSERQLL